MIDLLDYQRPKSFDELWHVLATSDVPRQICAGCTDLIPKNKAGLLLPQMLWLDLRRIPELCALEIGEKEARLGACVTHHRVATHERIRAELPALSAACGAIGSRQIRSLGTLGGNAANCSPCADSFLALVALDAEMVLRSPKGQRRILASEFPRGPGKTVLEEGEIIETFVVPLRQDRRGAFRKLGPRRAMAVAKVSAAASAVVEDGRLHDVRLVLGSVAPTVFRITEAEATLEGRKPDGELLRKVASIVERTVKPIDDPRSTAAYRRATSGVLARRTLEAILSEPR